DEEIATGHGFACAMIQAGPRKVGLFSANVSDNSVTGTTHVLDEVKKLNQFPKNRPDAFLIAGSSLAKNALVENGFENVTADTSARASVPEFWAASAGFLSRPRALNIAGLTQPLIVTDI